MYSSEENNNEESEGGKTETTQENQNETPMIGMVERTALYILRNQNWICVLMLTPISLIYDLYCFLSFWFVQTFFTNKINHEEGVKSIQRQVLEWRKSGMKTKMCSSRPSWKSITLQNLTYKDTLYKVEINLSNIISLDTERRIVRVEPMVSIGILNDYLIKLGWTVPVVPELDDLTIGGLVMGGGIETTSHKYGLFQSICKSYELVLSDGSVICCDKDNNNELFATIPFSYGTFGFLTAVDIDIVPYKPYLMHTYHPTKTLKDAVDLFEELSNDPDVDTVEGIVYSESESVIMSGKFVDGVKNDHPTNRIGRWYKPWFYKHVESFLTNQQQIDKEKFTEYIPTVDYFHRHNRAYFWLMVNQLSCANDAWFRYILGWSMPPKFSLLKFLRSWIEGGADKGPTDFCLQDYGIEINKLESMIDFAIKETEIFPIWLCPARKICPKEIQHLTVCPSDTLYVDVGVYGHSPMKGFHKITCQKRIENFLLENQGFVALYGETELSIEEFYLMFEDAKNNYDRVRKQYDCENAFPHVYTKISKLGRN